MTWQDSNLQSFVPKTNALSIRPQGLLMICASEKYFTTTEHGTLVQRRVDLLASMRDSEAGAGGTNNWHTQGSNLEPPAQEADNLSVRPTGPVMSQQWQRAAAVAYAPH